VIKNDIKHFQERLQERQSFGRVQQQLKQSRNRGCPMKFYEARESENREARREALDEEVRAGVRI